MATLFFTGAIDAAWATAGILGDTNWFYDSAGTVPRLTVPGNTDDVVIVGSADIATFGSARTVNTLSVMSGGISATDFSLTVTHGAFFIGQGTYTLGTLIGNCVFSGESAENDGTITGHCIFPPGSILGINNGPISGTLLIAGGGCDIGAAGTAGTLIVTGGTLTTAATFSSGFSAAAFINTGTLTSGFTIYTGAVTGAGTNNAKRPTDVLGTGL